MNLRLSNIVKLYRDTIIFHLGNSGAVDISLQMVQCWRSCAVDEDNWDLPIVLCFLVMMYKYYSRLEFSPDQTQLGSKNIHNKIFNNIPQFIKNCIHINFLQYGFFMCNDKVLFHKQYVIPPIPYSMIPMDFRQRNKHVINLTTDVIRSKFGFFQRIKWMRHV